MTKKPRSSRMSAACERPAPDNPVITTKSLTPRAYPAAPMGPNGQPAQVATGDEGEQSAGSSPPRTYSGARSRKPCGGAGSSIRPRARAGRGQRIHIAGQRPVDEADVHVLLDLFDGAVLDQDTGRCASTARAGRGPGRRSTRLPGVCRNGWFRKKTNRPPGRRTRATSAIARRPHRCARRPGRPRPRRTTHRGTGGHPRRERASGASTGRRAASITWLAVGSMPTTRSAPPLVAQAGDLALSGADVEQGS